eukprot:TRINITY_DN57548_c0_g1_i1.p1 TRINITY_DN57548_c0_g1~~TRINITY_DN57548_c0_g1_i1.p1  ORF type:complete len:365 (+),score=74.07 TRINITY_DN57548_c0_g1_i1:25-1095(+)
MALSKSYIALVEPEKFQVGAGEGQRQPLAGEALVRVGLVGVCGTDYHAYRGHQNFFTFPRVLGHELAVTVESIGEGTDAAQNINGVKVGDNCAVEPYINCGTCGSCSRGKGNCCERISVLGVHADGGLQDHLIVPLRKLHPSAKLSRDALALVETLCIGAHAVERAGSTTGENVLVVGGGPIGMSALQFVLAVADKDKGKVAVLDVSPQRLQFLREKLHVPIAIDGTGDPAEVEARIRDALGGQLPTVVIDATGNIHAMKRSFSFAGHGGRVIFVGHTKEQLAVDNPLFHSRELTVMASRNALGSDFKRVIHMIEEGKIDISPWITHRCKFAEFESHFTQWVADPSVIKAVVDLEQ